METELSHPARQRRLSLEDVRHPDECRRGSRRHGEQHEVVRSAMSASPVGEQRAHREQEGKQPRAHCGKGSTPRRAVLHRYARADGRHDTYAARARRLGVTVRERWFGASGRQVPELALAGQIELGDALVLDAADDVAALRAAFAAGTPVVVRASSPEQIKAALMRPEVSCVVVPDDQPELLDLDLTELTYG